MNKDALQLVTLRNSFYRDNFRRMAFVLLSSVLLNIILVAVLLFISANRPQPLYFATTNSGQLIPLASQQNPVMTDQAVIAWVNTVVPQIFSLDFLNYNSELNQSHQFFTNYGWNQFSNAFQPTINQIIAGQYVTKAAPSDVPVIVGKGVVEGVYTWRVQVPLLVTFQKGGQEQVKNVVWSLIVQRVNNNYSNQLLGISQVVQTDQSQANQ